MLGGGDRAHFVLAEAASPLAPALAVPSASLGVGPGVESGSAWVCPCKWLQRKLGSRWGIGRDGRHQG